MIKYNGLAKMPQRPTGRQKMNILFVSNKKQPDTVRLPELYGMCFRYVRARKMKKALPWADTVFFTFPYHMGKHRAHAHGKCRVALFTEKSKKASPLKYMLDRSFYGGVDLVCCENLSCGYEFIKHFKKATIYVTPGVTHIDENITSDETVRLIYDMLKSHTAEQV